MVKEIYVKKRDGRHEPLNHDKINQILEQACEGLSGVYPSEIALKAGIQWVDGISTQDIQDALVKTAADMIEPFQPSYQYVAARLKLFDIRKKVYGDYEPEDFLPHVKDMVHLGKYDKEILEKYSEEEVIRLGDYIDHNRDLEFAYSGMKQMEAKYLIKDRVTGQLYETPQMLYMMVAMCLFQDSHEEYYPRIEKVKRFYDYCSKQFVSLPTPILAGVRTPTRQFSSCTLIESGDNLDSINATSDAIVKYASKRAGIGINGGAIRAVGEPIRGGEAVHTGLIGFWNYFKGALKSCSQGAVRGAAATMFYPAWHYEFENVIVLKNNKGTEENRIRQLDYAVQLNKYLWDRLLDGKRISLFSPNVADGKLYEYFFSDQEKFAELYEELEANHAIRKKRIKAVDMFESIAVERGETGRIYIQFVDNTNDNSPFITAKAPIRQSNLCLEIALPTSPLQNIDGDEGEVALCTLAAFNVGRLLEPNEYGDTCFEYLEDVSDLLVEALDNLLDYQDYPVHAAYTASMKRRTLGIGITDYAHALAKRGLKYSDGSANEFTHNLAEALQYYTLKSSMKLAHMKGACSGFSETKYSEGWLPIDEKVNTSDKVFKTALKEDWEDLRELIAINGLRNSTLTALMPAETSSQISNSTNGIEPIRQLVVSKTSKDGVFKQLAPEVVELYTDYETCWDMKSNKGYLTICGIFSKFIDQSISSNTYYDPRNYEDGKVPATLIVNDMYYAYQIGLKTMYYHNTNDGNDEDDEACESGACKL